MKHNHNLPKDIDGNQLELGHIVAVRYVWNSYAGLITMKGLFVGYNYHDIQDHHHYQILGHENEDHKDYDEKISKWLTKHHEYKKSVDCPIKIRVYDNMKAEV